MLLSYPLMRLGVNLLHISVFCPNVLPRYRQLVVLAVQMRERGFVRGSAAKIRPSALSTPSSFRDWADCVISRPPRTFRDCTMSFPEPVLTACRRDGATHAFETVGANPRRSVRLDHTQQIPKIFRPAWRFLCPPPLSGTDPPLLSLPEPLDGYSRPGFLNSACIKSIHMTHSASLGLVLKFKPPSPSNETSRCAGPPRDTVQGHSS